MGAKKVAREFQDVGYAPELKQESFDDRTIHYAHLNNNNDVVLVFVHGAPGSWSAFVDYFKVDSLVEKFDMISFDRPGYGYSGFGIPEPSLEKQAYYLAEIAGKVYPNKKKIWVGHSLGGPVVARVAMDRPEVIDAAILIAPSIDPEQEKKFWYMPVLKTRLAKAIVPRTIWTANEEIVPLKEELEEMLPLWKSIDIPVLVLQGTKDRLVPKENAFFAEKMVKPEMLTVWLREGMNHFIPFTKPELVIQAIMETSSKIALESIK